MSTLGPYASTGNSSGYVKSQLDYSFTRNSTGYTITATIKFQRTNNYSGTPTRGTANGTIYVNGSSIGSSGNKSFTVPNDKSLVSLYTATKTISLGATSSGSFTIGYSVSTPSGSGNNPYFNVSTKTSGSVSVPAYTTVTACGAPIWKTGNGATFYGNAAGGNGKVTVTWNAGTAGTGNSVTGYIIQARYPKGGTQNTYEDSWYEKWNSTGTSATLIFDGWANTTYPCDIQLRIRTKGSAGASYYSGWSSTIYVRSLARTKCGAPTSITTSSTYANPGDSVTISWSGASSGTNNAINGYEIQWGYREDPWGSGTGYGSKNVSSTSSSSSTSVTVPSGEGKSIDYRVRTKGPGGTNYYSDWKQVNSLVKTRTKPTAGTTTCSLNSNGSVSISWSGFSSGTDNSISGYELWYQSSADNSTWSDRVRVPGYTTGLKYSYTWTTATKNTYYRFCAVALGKNYLYSNTSAYGNSIKVTSTTPTNPTSCTVTNSTCPYLGTYTDPVTGAGTQLVDLSNTTASRTVYAKFSGGSNIAYYRVSIGYCNASKDPTSTGNYTYTSLTSTLSPSTSLSVALHTLTHGGEWIRFRVDSTDYLGTVSSGYYYSPPIRVGGGVWFKSGGAYKMYSPKIKVSGAYRPVSMVWLKVNGTWRRTV